MKKAFTIPSPLAPLPQCERGRRGFTLASQLHTPIPNPSPSREKGVAAKAFTLVELIVVITILAILGTIAFISLQGYSREARDSKRIQDIRSLMTKLNVENVKGTPYREMLVGGQIHHVKINGNAEEVYQGYIDFEYLRENRDNFLDPSTNRDYEFATSEGTTRYNNEDQRFNFIEGRYKSEKTNEEVILGNYYKYLPDDAENLFTGSINPYEGPAGITEVPNGLCADCKNIIIKDGNGNGYTIMDRNLGASTSDVSQCTTVSCPQTIAGNHYQWGRNIGFSPDKTITDINGDTNVRVPINFADRETNTDFIWNTNLGSYGYDWSIEQEDEAWGGVSGNYSKMRGPCPSGYHVPASHEWLGLINMGYNASPKLWGENPLWTLNGEAYTISGIPQDMIDALKIPLAGRRNRNDPIVVGGGGFGGYWSSDTSLNLAYRLSFASTDVTPKNTYGRVSGLSVRCFKN